MPHLPIPFGSEGDGLPGQRQLAKAKRIREHAELDVYQHQVRAQAVSAMDQADSQAAAEAADFALDLEMDLFDRGMSRSGQSAAKLELTARKVSNLSNANNRRFARWFGG